MKSRCKKLREKFSIRSFKNKVSKVKDYGGNWLVRNRTESRSLAIQINILLKPTGI